MDHRVENLIKDARAANKVDRERAELFTALLKTEGWKSYVELLNVKIQALSESILAPAGSVDGMVGLEYVKGAMSGLLVARDLPGVTITAMEQLRPQEDSDEEIPG